MNLQIPWRDPDKAYISYGLWLPKRHINVQATEWNLTYWDASGRPLFSDYQHTKDHLIVPRMMIHPNQYALYSFPFVDVRPHSYPKFEVYTTRQPRDTYPTDFAGPRALLENESGLLNYACGKGKSSVALSAWAQLGCAGLIVVDETTLMEQWRELFTGNKDKGTPPLYFNKDGSLIEVGIIQGPKADFRKPISLATVQTLAAHADEWPEEMRRYHGVIIYDEVHVFAAPVFSRAVRLFMGRRWGVSATLYRQDRMESVYFNHIGPILDVDLTPELVPRAEFIRTNIRAHSADKAENAIIVDSITDKNGQFNFSKYTGWLGRHPYRNEHVVKQVIDELLADGRKILALSNCRDQTNILHQMYPTSGVLNSGIPQDNRLAFLRSCPVTFGIYRIAQKGLDAVDLDTLVLLTPVQEHNLLQQAIGRIQRIHKAKKEPLVVILEDSDRASFDKAQTIRAYLRSNGIRHTTRTIS